MRYLVLVLVMLCWSAPSAIAQVSVGIGLPGVSIGINLPLYPELAPVPGYPVYYAPRLTSNYFFYDGMYWVYQGDNWYASSWYNGPWGLVAPDVVPLYVLRVPVGYYRQPPAYFQGWQSDAPPRWGEHWGPEWEQHRHGWDQWNRGSAPARAPLPVYQRRYAGDRYPPAEQQQELHHRNYRYQPRDPVVRQQYQERAAQGPPAPSQREQQGAPQERRPERQDVHRPNQQPPVQQDAPAAPRAQPPPRGDNDVRRSAPTNAPPQEKGPTIQHQKQQQPEPHPQRGATQREQQTPESPGKHNQQPSQQPSRGQGQGQGHGQGQGQGHKQDQDQGSERGQGAK